MVPKEENQPWIRTRPLPASCRCDGCWCRVGGGCHILPPPLVSAKPRFNCDMMSMKRKYSQVIWSLWSHMNFLNGQANATSLPTIPDVLLRQHFILKLRLCNKLSHYYWLCVSFICTCVLCVLYRTSSWLESAAQFTMTSRHSVELWKSLNNHTGRGARRAGGFPYVTLNYRWSCESETERADSAGPQALLCRTVGAASNLTIIKGNKPCHAVGANSYQLISFDFNGRIYQSTGLENVFYLLCEVAIVFTMSFQSVAINAEFSELVLDVYSRISTLLHSPGHFWTPV